MTYAMYHEAISQVLPEPTNSNTNCGVEYALYLGTDEISTSTLADIVSFDSTTRTVTVFYDTDNEFGGNTHTLSYKSRYVGDTAWATSQDFSLVLDLYCNYATLTEPSDTSMSYTVNENSANWKDYTFDAFTTNDSYCEVTYSLFYDDAGGDIDSSWTSLANDQIPSTSTSDTIIYYPDDTATIFKMLSTDNADARNDYDGNG
jgi:hypothetical protein